MNEKQILEVSKTVFKEVPLEIERKTIGMCNEVYELRFSSESFILRMNEHKDILYGTHKFLPLFKQLQIKTPDIVFEDYSKSHLPFCYHILTKIPGRDLGLVIDKLNDVELKQIAYEISSIFDKFNLPSTQNEIRQLLEEKQGNHTSLWEGIEEQKNTVSARNETTKVLDGETMAIYDEVLDKYKAYFLQVEPKWYYDDICYKNVMIDNGQFSGLVDLDFLVKGDYLSAIGTIMSSYYGERYGKGYLSAIMEKQGLDEFEQNIVCVYAILNLVLWTSEEGIKFNSNSSGTVNWDNVNKKKKKISEIYWGMKNK